MKRVITSANFGGYKYRYEVHWMSPDGNDKLLGGSNDLSEAERIAIDNLNRIFTNPWEDSSRKALFIENCYIYDCELDDVVDSIAVENKQDTLLNKLSY